MAKDKNMNTTEAEIKAVAKAAGASLRRAGHQVPHTALLHALSAALNKRDWHTVKAALGTAEATPAAPADKPNLVTVYRCQNCDFETLHETELKEPKDLWERVAPGEPVPAGECPDCGALCHGEDVPADEAPKAEEDATPKMASQKELLGPPVQAEFWTDDRVVEVKFDARPFLMQAHDKELVAIMEAGYRGDYATDAIAEFMGTHDDNLADGFKYLQTVQKSRRGSDIGFECSIHKEQFLQWLDSERPALLAKHLCSLAGVDVKRFKDADTEGGEWGWDYQFEALDEKSSSQLFETEEAATLDAYKQLNLLARATTL